MIWDSVSELQSPLPNEKKVKFWIKKLVSDIVDYCNRTDFPVALIYTAVELICKRLDDENVDETTGSSAPLKKIKQDDTEFEFAVDNVSVVGLSSDADFETIKPKLNLYRKVRAL